MHRNTEQCKVQSNCLQKYLRKIYDTKSFLLRVGVLPTPARGKSVRYRRATLAQGPLTMIEQNVKGNVAE